MQVVIGTIAIRERLLLPNADSLPFAPPQQSYLRHGPVSFDYTKDICKDQALLVIEHDVGQSYSNFTSKLLCKFLDVTDQYDLVSTQTSENKFIIKFQKAEVK